MLAFVMLAAAALCACRTAFVQGMPTPPADSSTVPGTPTPPADSGSVPGTPLPPDRNPIIGAMLSPEEVEQWCSELPHYGVRAVSTTVRWNMIEPQTGEFDWTVADDAVQVARSCGLEVGVHVLSVSSWGTLPPEDGSVRTRKIPSMPPRHMGDYYNFVSEFAAHYKGQVSRYSFENEAAAEANWGSSPESYFDLLCIAHQAVTDADPQALVLNSGISSSALGLLMANDMLEDGHAEAAVDFLGRYYAHFAPGRVSGHPVRIATVTDLEAVLNDPIAQRVLTWAPQLFANHSCYDALQVHYYGPWDQLETVLSWLRSQLAAQGADKPIEIWELGYGWQDASSYDELRHAQDTTKLLVTALGEGSDFAIYWRFTDWAERQGTGVTGLIGNNVPRPAATAYRITAEKLAGVVSGERLELEPALWAYRFAKETGDLYVVWSTEPMVARLPIESSTVTITDTTGHTASGDPRALSVGASPVFVEDR